MNHSIVIADMGDQSTVIAEIILWAICAGIAFALIGYLLERGYSRWWVLWMLFFAFWNIFGLPAMLLVWLTHRSYISIDTKQRQCPNCGGYRVFAGPSKRKRKDDPVIYAYTCALCGYQWNWQEGTSWPAATVKPDLMHKGQQYLDQQAAIERQRAEQAAMAFQAEQERRLRDQ